MMTRLTRLHTTQNSTHNNKRRLSKVIKKSIAIYAMSAIAVLSFNYSALAGNKAPQDKMVMIAEHALHTMILGEGEFTVIFESGFGNDLSHWRKVAPVISKKAKVVAYSRAGYGKSDSIAKPRTLTETTKELSELIKAANLQPPFIFVGHSYGSHIIRTYAAQNSDEVAGLIFVDPANEAFFVNLKALDKAKTNEFLNIYEKMIPEKLRAESKILMAIDKRGALPDFGPLPDVPAAIITSMVPEHPQFIIHSVEGKNIWRQLHNKLFNQFSSASHITTMESGHNIAIQEPALVIEAIEKVIKQASKASQKKQIAKALNEAKKLIEHGKLKQAENTIFTVFTKTSLAPEKINSLGYQYLSASMESNQNNILAALVLKYNLENTPESANAFDSYGESLLALNKPEQAKKQFLEAIKIIKTKNNNSRALKGYIGNLAKAELAIKEQSK